MILGSVTFLYVCTKNINPTNIEWIFSYWLMPSIILSIILMCKKLIIQLKLTYTHQHINFPPHRKYNAASLWERTSRLGGSWWQQGRWKGPSVFGIGGSASFLAVSKVAFKLVNRAAIPVYFCTGRDPFLAVYVPLQRLHLGSTATVWIGPGIKMTVSKCSIQIT